MSHLHAAEASGVAGRANLLRSDVPHTCLQVVCRIFAEERRVASSRNCSGVTCDMHRRQESET